MNKLKARRKEYGIPETPYLPMGKNVLVYRLPEEEQTVGGLYLPETVREPKDRGVLLAAGLTALDILTDHLVELGDIVWFGHYAGRESEVQRMAESKGTKILQVKVDDVLGSVDALDRVRLYAIALNEDGEHVYVKPANDNGVANEGANNG